MDNKEASLMVGGIGMPATIAVHGDSMMICLFAHLLHFLDGNFVLIYSLHLLGFECSYPLS